MNRYKHHAKRSRDSMKQEREQDVEREKDWKVVEARSLECPEGWAWERNAAGLSGWIAPLTAEDFARARRIHDRHPSKERMMS